MTKELQYQLESHFCVEWFTLHNASTQASVYLRGCVGLEVCHPQYLEFLPGGVSRSNDGVAIDSSDDITGDEVLIQQCDQWIFETKQQQIPHTPPNT